MLRWGFPLTIVAQSSDSAPERQGFPPVQSEGDRYHPTKPCPIRAKITSGDRSPHPVRGRDKNRWAPLSVRWSWAGVWLELSEKEGVAIALGVRRWSAVVIFCGLGLRSFPGVLASLVGCLVWWFFSVVPWSCVCWFARRGWSHPGLLMSKKLHEADRYPPDSDPPVRLSSRQS